MITIFMKHAKNFVSSEYVRPLFRCVNFDGEYCTATNTYIAVTIPFKSEKKLVNYFTGMELKDEKFPDTKNAMIKEKDIKYTAIISTFELPKMINSLKVISKMKKGFYNYFLFTKNGIEFNDNLQQHYSAKFEIQGEFLEGATYRTKYLIDILNFFNDMPKPIEVKFEFTDNTHNTVQISANGCIGLISSMRRYKE